MRRTIAILSVVLLVSCGEDGPREDQIVIDQKIVDIVSVDAEAIDEIVNDNGHFLALEILRRQEEMGLATNEDLAKKAEILDLLLDGVATEVAVEKLEAIGTPKAQTALILSRALFLQLKFDEAWDALKDLELSDADRYDAFILRGDIASYQQNSDVARENFIAAIEDRPERTGGYIGVANLELGLGNFKEAKKYADQAIKIAVEDPVANYVLGVVARYAGQPEVAIGFLTTSVKVELANVPAHVELAGVYIEQNDLEKAKEQLDLVYRVDPTNVMARYNSALIAAMEGRTQDAEEILLLTGNLVRVYPPAARTYGVVSHLLGKCDAALSYLSTFLKTAPQDRVSRLALADCQAQLNMPADALLTLGPILETSDNDLDAFVQASAAAIRGEDTNLAIEYTIKALELSQKEGPSTANLTTGLRRRLSLLHANSGDYAGATQELLNISKENETDTVSLLLLANLQLGQGEYAQADQTAAKILAIEPDSPAALNVKGAVQYYNRKPEEAVVYYDRAIAQNGEYESALKNRALALVALKRFDEAEKDLRWLVGKAPKDGQVHGMLGRVLLELGEPERAVAELKIAERILPNSAIIATDHALALARNGFVVTAIKQAGKARKLAAGEAGLADYLDGLILTWEEQEAERRSLKAEKEAAAKQAYAKEKAAREKLRQELAEKVKTETSDKDSVPDN